MNSIKSQIFNYLTKVQKSNLCHFIASFVKKNPSESIDKLAEKFVEDQKYYIEINSTRFPFLDEYFEELEFIEHLKLYIKECQKKLKFKESQKPLYEKQKAYLKEQRKKIQEFKMAKAPPTKAQIYYYKKLCEKYKLENHLEAQTSSRLDYKNAIDKLLEGK